MILWPRFRSRAVRRRTAPTLAELRARRDAAAARRPTWSSCGSTRSPIPMWPARCQDATGPGHRDLPRGVGRRALPRAAKRRGWRCSSRPGTRARSSWTSSLPPGATRRGCGRPAASGWCVSSHDFAGVPADLAARYRAMMRDGRGGRQGRRHGARPSPTACRCWRLRPPAPQRHVVLAMGAPGLVTRLLPQRFGSAWTYAGRWVAPGTDAGAPAARRVPVRRGLPPTPRSTAIVANPVGALRVAGHAQRRASRRPARRRVPAARSRRCRRRCWRLPRRSTCAAPASRCRSRSTCCRIASPMRWRDASGAVNTLVRRDGALARLQHRRRRACWRRWPAASSSRACAHHPRRGRRRARRRHRAAPAPAPRVTVCARARTGRRGDGRRGRRGRRRDAAAAAAAGTCWSTRRRPACIRDVDETPWPDAALRRPPGLRPDLQPARHAPAARGARGRAARRSMASRCWSRRPNAQFEIWTGQPPAPGVMLDAAAAAPARLCRAAS